MNENNKQQWIKEKKCGQVTYAWHMRRMIRKWQWHMHTWIEKKCRRLISSNRGLIWKSVAVAYAVAYAVHDSQPDWLWTRLLIVGYTSVQIRVHQYTSVQISIHQYTSVSISTHQYTIAHIEIYSGRRDTGHCATRAYGICHMRRWHSICHMRGAYAGICHMRTRLIMNRINNEPN